MLEMSEEARKAARDLAHHYAEFIVNVATVPSAEGDKHLLVNGRALIDCYDALGVEIISRETVMRILAAAAWRESSRESKL